jgi:hypothetical protein
MRVYHPSAIDRCRIDLPIFFVNQKGENVSAFLTTTNFIINISEPVDCKNEFEVYVGNSSEVIKKGKQIVQKEFSFSTEKLVQDEDWFEAIQDQVEENKYYPLLRDCLSYFSYIVIIILGILVKKIRSRLLPANKEIADKQAAGSPEEEIVSDSNTFEVNLVSEVSNDKASICKFCGFVAVSERGLKTHQNFKHKNMITI